MVKFLGRHIISERFKKHTFEGIHQGFIAQITDFIICVRLAFYIAYPMHNYFLQKYFRYFYHLLPFGYATCVLLAHDRDKIPNVAAAKITGNIKTSSQSLM